ncbi:hypothetical protein H0R92_00575 [Treponema sp. OMZ 840]|uniref:hypothetical protein n=1 Tax=Treponema sp. OMZ 840 TaxID=244313 RepID=UPI003D8A2FD6
MIIRSFFMYGILCIVPIIYGIGIKKLLYTNYSLNYLVLSGIKSACTAVSAILATWFLALNLLAPYSLAVLFPFFTVAISFLFSFIFDKIINICFKIKTEEFDIAFLSVILAVSEGFTLKQTLIIAVICVLSFYLLYPLLAAIRKRLRITNTDPAFADNIMIFLTLALISCGFYGWNLSWLNPEIFK